MSLGTLPLIATEEVTNLIHLVLDKESYESTGGQLRYGIQTIMGPCIVAMVSRIGNTCKCSDSHILWRAQQAKGASQAEKDKRPTTQEPSPPGWV